MDVNAWIKDINARLGALEGRVLRSRRGEFVPVNPTALVDSASTTWSGATPATGTYTFRPADNANIWPSTAKGVVVFVAAAWSSASGSYNILVRAAAAGANADQIQSYVAGIGGGGQCVVGLDGSGYFYLVVGGAAPIAAIANIVGYFR